MTLPSESSSYFEQAVYDWKELNCTADFSKFYEELHPLLGSTIEILYHKNSIVEVVNRHLQISTSLAIVPISYLAVALAKDLLDEFYPIFPSVFRALIVPLRASRDPEVIEAIFISILNMCKFLQRYLVKDILKIFDLFEPLFIYENVDFIRRFACQCFGYLLRNCKDFDSIFDYLCANMKSSVYNENILAELFTNTLLIESQHLSKCAELF